MDNPNIELNRFDEYYGVVIGHCRTGIYILLENNVTVYSYHGAPDNSRGLCSVQKLGNPETNRLPLVVVGSVFVDNAA